MLTSGEAHENRGSPVDINQLIAFVSTHGWAGGFLLIALSRPASAAFSAILARWQADTDWRRSEAELNRIAIEKADAERQNASPSRVRRSRVTGGMGGSGSNDPR